MGWLPTLNHTGAKGWLVNNSGHIHIKNQWKGGGRWIASATQLSTSLELEADIYSVILCACASNSVK